MSDIEVFFQRARAEAKDLLLDGKQFVASLSDFEQAVMLALFALFLAYVTIRRPSDEKHSGSMARQFIFALAIVGIFGYGAMVLTEGGRLALPDFNA